MSREGKNGFVLTVVTRLATIKRGLDQVEGTIKTGLEHVEADTETRLAKIRRALLFPPIPTQLTCSLSETDTLYKE